MPPQNPDLSFDALYAQAVEARPLLERTGNQILADIRKKFPGKFDNAYLEMGDIKDKTGALNKITTDYNGEHARITDLARGRIVVETPEQARILQQYVAEHQAALGVQTMKDRFSSPSNTNYRDVLTTLKMDNGHVAEFRIEQKEMTVAGKLTHGPYKELQQIERAAEARLLTPQEDEARGRLTDKIRDTHQAAADRANLDPLLSDKGQEKVAKFEGDRTTPRSNGYYPGEDITGSISKPTQLPSQPTQAVPGDKAPPAIAPVTTQPASAETQPASVKPNASATAGFNKAIGIGAIAVNSADAILKGDPKKLAVIGGTTVAVTGASRGAGLLFGTKAVPVVGQVIGAGFAANDSIHSFQNGNTTRGAITGLETTLYGIAAGAGIATVADCWNPTVVAPATVALVAGGAALTITAAKTVYDSWNTIRGWFSSSANDQPKPDQPHAAADVPGADSALPRTSSGRPRLAELRTGTAAISPQPNTAERPDMLPSVAASIVSRQPKAATPAPAL